MKKQKRRKDNIIKKTKTRKKRKRRKVHILKKDKNPNIRKKYKDTKTKNPTTYKKLNIGVHTMQPQTTDNRGHDMRQGPSKQLVILVRTVPTIA